MPKFRASTQSLKSKFLHVVWGKWWARLGSAALAVLIIFSLGLEVGSGRIHVGLGASFASQNSGLPAQLDYTSVNEVYNTLRSEYNGKLTEAQLLAGLKQGLAAATNDPYTEYFDAKAATAFTQQLNNSFSGIGAELGKDDQGNLIVVSPIKGFPADLAGLRAKDMIVSINGDSTSGTQPDVAATKIRGPVATTAIVVV